MDLEILLVDPVVHDRQQPGGALECVGTAGLQVERAQSPVLELPQEVPGANPLSQVQFTLEQSIQSEIF